MSTLQNHSIPSLPNLHLRGHFRKLAHYFRPHLHSIIVIILPIYIRPIPHSTILSGSLWNQRERERERDNWNFFWFSSGFSFLSIAGKILSDSLCLDNTHFGKKEILESDWSINNPNGAVNCSLTRKWEAKWQRGIFRSFPERTSRTVL